jgi:glycine/D-amino acid oxidase-like deaminating enzyme
MAVSLGLNLQTHTPVTVVTRSEDTGWKVNTPTREAKSTKVFHATNAYTSRLLPEFTGVIVPLKGHVAAILPSTEYEQRPLDRTMAFVWDEDYDYVIQRHGKGKHIILGGRDLDHPEGLTSILGDSNDSTWTKEIAQGLRKFPSENFEDWAVGKGNGNDVQQRGEAKVWTELWASVRTVYRF